MSQTSGRPDADDVVVLLDSHGAAIGTADRTAVHGADTPLHLAFSCYLFDASGRVLLSRRALTKKTWPGVWTNTACGHPRPGESGLDAARRRLGDELGVGIEDPRLVLPTFSYRAVDASGIVENELCPVWVGVIDTLPPTPNPDEVAELTWVEWSTLVALAQTVPALLSPWSVLQIPLLDAAFQAEAGAA